MRAMNWNGHLFFLIICILGVTLCESKPSNASTEYVQTYEFNYEWFKCFAVKTLKSDFGYPDEESCPIPQDGGGCAGPDSYIKGERKPLKLESSEGVKVWLTCEDIICPEGYECGGGTPFSGVSGCCLIENRMFAEEMHSDNCPNGSKASGYIRNERTEWAFFEAKIGRTCDDLICEKGYSCQQVNKFMAKCCKTA
ncbi:hypothetical protein L596_016698 [Steinernema carpocapsae]|uniref:Uncharacterized protein n=1 Tax=Steinernema carpocapsae TaxID=34508 RepID=A0A4V6A3G6_STECR|nr:hypothetical protein L596_016698 [Steinernema carpocapsae]